MKNITSIGLIVAILIVLNILSKQFFLRFDLTEDKRYSLSNATKNILRNLEDPVTVKAYFTPDIRQDITNAQEDFKDLLIEYGNISKGMVDYEIIDPGDDEAIQQEAAQNGVQPMMIQIREKDQVKQQSAFLGAVIQMGEQRDVIPIIQDGMAMEYALSTGIKKMSVVDKPSVGLIQGHGEPSLQELAQAYQSLNILYNIENVDLNTEESIGDRFRTLALVNPQDSIPPTHFQKLDAYLAKGGKLFIAIDAVKADLQNQSGTPFSTGTAEWLREKGLEVESSFVIDAQCGGVTVQQQRGFFKMNSTVQVPFLPTVSNFADHPITKGLEQVTLPFASPVRFLGDSSKVFTPLLFSSQKSSIVPAPTQIQVTDKQWGDQDFPLSGVTMGGILSGNLVGDMASAMVVIGDGEFPIGGQERRQNPDAINLMVNSIDWLSDDTGLIELRTKGIATRPIDDLEDSRRSFLKYLNFGLPILLILLYGFFRFQRQRTKRLRRAAERYS